MTTLLVESPFALQKLCDERRARGDSVAVVPTMGALHAGHLRLIKHAAELSTFTVVTIFVNPTQFGPNEDFDRYPRDLEADRRLSEEGGASAIFAPQASEMYPPGDATRVSVRGLTEHLCGPFRPGHFEGVATVVAKLFALVGRGAAVFGRKDYQQLKVIERMVRDLMLPVQIVGLETVREQDGLAQSSRNRYLSANERERALSIPRALSEAARSFSSGERRVAELRRRAQREIEQAGLEVQYVSVAHPETLAPWPDDAELEGEALVAVAAFAGKTRLIDNLLLGQEGPIV